MPAKKYISSSPRFSRRRLHNTYLTHPSPESPIQTSQQRYEPLPHLILPIIHGKSDRCSDRPSTRQPVHITKECKAGTAHDAPGQLMVIRVLPMQLEAVLFVCNVSRPEHAITVLRDPAQDLIVGINCQLQGWKFVGDLGGEIYLDVGGGARGAEDHL